MPRHLISERDVIEAARSGEKSIRISAKTIITDAAKERARILHVRFVSQPEGASQQCAPSPPKRSSPNAEVIAIGGDHGGFALKGVLKAFLEELGYTVVDLGTYSNEPCDYPDFAYSVARMVSLGEASKGIMIDAVGTASAMVANKVPGVRAACCHSEFVARSSREHNDANVLTLGGRVLGDELAKSIVRTWLETWFGGGRHGRRVEKITEVEKRFLK